MKKFAILFVLAALFCFAAKAAPVDPATAKSYAQNFWRLSCPQRAAADFRNVAPEAGFDHLYIFNNQNGSGFVIISADDAAIPVLGYSDANNFDATQLPDNLRFWLSGYNRVIREIADANVAATPEVAQQWNNLAEGRFPVEQLRDAVSPMLTTTWDQGAPYNGSCPGTSNNRSATGCVATAMAQVMKFWNWPATGTGSHSYSCNFASQGFENYGTLSANFGATTYDWGNMLNTYASANSGTDAQRAAVATLMYHCGVAVEMMYSPEGSGAYTLEYYANTPSAEHALKTYFGYKSTLVGRSKSYMNQNYQWVTQIADAQWINYLKADLNAGRPIVYSGTDEPNQGGHCFVCDGYNSSNQFHFNWGWSGYGNGYYAVTSLIPGGGGIGGGSYDFSYGQEAIFGIEPNNGGGGGGGGGGDDPQATECDYQHYPLPGTPAVYTVQTGGYLAGTNAYGDEAKADYFTYPTSGTVSKIKIALGAMDGTSGSVDFTVWADNNGTPGNVLGSKTVTLATIYNGMDEDTYEYECVFDSPIAITGNFFAGLNITNADSYFALQTTTDGDGPNTGWELYQGTWTAYSDSWDASLTNAIFPFVCPDENDDPDASAFDLRLYSAITATPNPLQQNASASFNVQIANYGEGTFNGTLKFVLETTGGTETQVLQQGSVSNGLTSLSYVPLTPTANITAAPGNYRLAVYYKDVNASNWTLVPQGDYTNPLAITVASPAAPNLQMFTNFSYTPNPLQQNSNATVSVSVLNQGTAAFSGKLKLVLETSSAQQVQLIQQKTVSGLNANSTDIYSFTGNITAAPGNYNMALYYQPNGSTTWTYVGHTYNANLLNPKGVTVTGGTGIADNNSSFSIVPNPATDYITVDCEGRNINRVEIYNAIGERMIALNNVASGETINISKLTAGVYFVRLTTDEGVVSRKIVKR